MKNLYLTLLICFLAYCGLKGQQRTPFLVKDINSGTYDSDPSLLTELNGKLLFQSINDDEAIALFSTDGTSEGTVQLIKITSNSWFWGSSLTKINNNGYFVAHESITLFSAATTSLYKISGSTNSITKIKEINSFYNGIVYDLTDVNGILFFVGENNNSNFELWKSDGTSNGTVVLKNINPGASSYLQYLTNVSGTLYFSASDSTNGYELWKSDGTDSGTVMVKDINSSDNSAPSNLTNINSILYFSATDGTNGYELWKSDGTDSGTVMVKDINSSGNSSPSNLTNVNGILYFSATDGTNGIELWKSDGTDSGTVMVKDINPDSSSFPNSLTDVNGILYFSATEDTFGTELWKSDGTDSGTVMVKDINSSGNSSPSNLININGTLYFSADDDTNGVELWKSDGTIVGTYMVADIDSGINSSSPENIFMMDSILFCSAYHQDYGRELWGYIEGVCSEIKLSSYNQDFKSDGGSGNFDIISQRGCSWSVSKSVDWIDFLSSNAGNVPITFEYTVDMNSSGASRTGYIYVNNDTFVVNQADTLIGLNEVKKEVEIKIYPNPFNISTNIIIENCKSNHLLLTITDIYGREVLSKNFFKNSFGDLEIKLYRNELKNNVYLLNIYDEKNVIIKRDKILIF